ncbi:MAG: YbaB/EbfC family nucleoid-associated protein [Hyphomicrobiales bacterium]|nr:YbaB/EbfC family nucleoid-associated protein [Hyphomicrobiales bacterium]MCP5371874.1 YbaB/EbfC family nucleoid-associated protein [Hyphomicrobiales bacterium]
MKNLGQMMKQAQQMQQKVVEMQEQLESLEVTGASGGGMVQVTLNGKSEARKVRIDPSLFQSGDAEMLEDLVLAAINDAKAKVQQVTMEKMSEITGGLSLPPGMQLPF